MKDNDSLTAFCMCSWLAKSAAYITCIMWPPSIVLLFYFHSIMANSFSLVSSHSLCIHFTGLLAIYKSKNVRWDKDTSSGGQIKANRH